MRVHILSLFPGYFRSPLDESILKRAQQQGLVDIQLIDIREFSTGRYRQVDDRPYGGGPGMVLMPEPVTQAIRAVKDSSPPAKVVYLSPQGRPLTAHKARELAQEEHIILLCGHYEGIDQRAIDAEVDEEISIGDYVLTNGCLAALVLLDAMLRFVPDVLGHHAASAEDSFERELLDCPHYTRPEVFEGQNVPQALRTGNHETIRRWRLAQALTKTQEVRPDLYQRYLWRQEEEGETKETRRSAPPLQRVALQVANLQRSKRFYRDLLRLEILWEGPDTVVFSLEGTDLLLQEGRPEVAGLQLEIALGQRQMNELAKRVTELELGSFEAVDSHITQVWLADPDGYRWMATPHTECGKKRLSKKES